MENQEFIKGKTKSGIEFTINPAIKDDTRILYCLTRMKDKSLEPLESSKYLFKMLEYMFGGGEVLDDFMNAVAAAHDGVADAQSLLTEVTEMFEACKLKNS